MKVTARNLVDWNVAVEVARTTQNKATTGINNLVSSDAWKQKIITARHSPLRAVQFLITFEDVPYFVMVHLVRHKIGVEWFVGTSREDKTGIDRSKRKQTDLINMQCIINADALLTISERRLCKKADPETTKVWMEVKNAIKKVDNVLYNNMQPQCFRFGKCIELNGCGRTLDNNL